MAITIARKNPISIITGYAGTGKSYTTRQLSLQLVMNGWKISRVAPTGRAAQLISGRTIHSWLDPIIEELPGNKVQIIGFRKQVMKEKECLIIDEFSMVDNELWNKIKSIWAQSKHLNSKKIVIVGDPGQLEPIGDGKPFIKMITNKTYPITNLKKIYRNSRNSDILKLASYVRRNGYLNIKSDCQQIKLITSEQALQMARDHQSIQFITPRRTSSVGSLALNKRIKQIMNITSPPDFHTLLWNDKQRLFVKDASVHKGDKVVVVRNIWQWNITNGTIGIYLGKTKVKLFNHVREEYSRLQSVYKFRNPDTNKIFYLPINSDIRSKLELAYAITIHKAQGSEYNSIILYLPTTQIKSKMLYTAITRTTNMLYIYRSKKPYGT